MIWCISSPKSLDIIFILVFLFFVFQESFQSYSLLQHSMVNNLRGAKGQWKWPSILDTIVIQEFVALRRLEKKVKKEHRGTPPPKNSWKKKAKPEKSQALFFSWAYCRLYFLFCVSKILKNRIKMVADCGATCAKYLLCLFNFVFFVSIHYFLFIYKDIYLHQKGSILSL